MILKRFYDEKLAQASYLVACAKSGEGIVIDPNRDAQQYVHAAESEGVTIVAVTETHIHADFASGSRELATATGATLYLSDEGDADWKYAFIAEGKPLRHGDTFRLGAIRFDVLRTPGHTPEHISFLVTDEAASAEPWGMFTGDFLFVGDVGRPDLLESAAGIQGTMEKGAHDLFRSLQDLKGLPDHLLVWPGHGSGSACGKSLGGVPVSSLGFERRANWGLRAVSEALFKDEVLSGQPDPPRYFAQMKRLNKTGPPILGGLPSPERLSPEHLTQSLDDGIVLDVRPSVEHAQGHIPGTLHIPLTKSFTNWAGWLLAYDKAIYLLANSDEQVQEAARDLALIGLDNVKGWFGTDALEAYEQSERPLTSTEQMESSEALAALRSGEVTLLDVRSRAEYENGHVPEAIHVPLGDLAERAQELPRNRPIAVHCQSGGRSPIAVSLLENLGFTGVANVTGGYAQLQTEATETAQVAPAPLPDGLFAMQSKSS